MDRSAPDAKHFESLTSAERECLALVLDHRTAKEIAIELGVTHHAVEKRLKRAREKLGAQSSIEAAKWSASWEHVHYGETGYGAPDLSPKSPLPHSASQSAHPAPRLRRYAMNMALALGLTVVLAGSQNAADLDASTIASELEKTLATEVAQARESFARLDLDGSGAIEKQEFVSPLSQYVVGESASESPPVYVEADEISFTRLEGEELERVLVTLDSDDTRKRREAMFNLIDRNTDGRLEEGEFTMAHLDGVSPRSFKIELTGDDG